jgi:guanylate kinase
LSRHPDLVLSVSATTRAPRPGEREGFEYYFVSRDEFERGRDAGELLEWADVYGELYGTPREPLKRALAAGKGVLLEIDVQGARSVKRAMPDALLIFVAPPSSEALEARLRARASESPDALKRRLDTALEELKAANEFDVTVVNDDLDRAIEELDRILFEPKEGASP